MSKDGGGKGSRREGTRRSVVDPSLLVIVVYPTSMTEESDGCEAAFDGWLAEVSKETRGAFDEVDRATEDSGTRADEAGTLDMVDVSDKKRGG